MSRDIFDILPPEVIAKVDEDGYSLLAVHGYKTDRVTKFEKRRKRLARDLRRNGDSLVYKTFINQEEGKILIYFELRRRGKVLGRSNGVCCVMKRGGADECV